MRNRPTFTQLLILRIALKAPEKKECSLRLKKIFPTENFFGDAAAIETVLTLVGPRPTGEEEKRLKVWLECMAQLAYHFEYELQVEDEEQILAFQIVTGVPLMEPMVEEPLFDYYGVLMGINQR